MYRNGVVDVLSEFNVHATTFLITSCVDNKNLMWVNKLNAMRRLRGERMAGCYAGLMMKYGLPLPASGDPAQAAMMTWPMSNKEEMTDELWKMCDMPPLEQFLDEHRPYFTWRQLEDWVSRGHSIGMHTHTHTVCARIGDTLAEQEIRRPCAALKERFRLNALPLAYPFGSRLEARLEEKLFQEGVFDFALGIRGFSSIGTPPHKLERENGEQQLKFKMLGKALL
jgi:peptidoglycan/xylan/chitin deacetylase (PgdA/CDA1 family)